MSTRAAGPLPLTAVLVAGWLTACGFHPLYATEGTDLAAPVAAQLAGVRILALDGRVGQALRNDLLDRITPLGEPAAPDYTLFVDLKESKEGLAIQRDATVTRFNLTLTANYALLHPVTRVARTSGTVRATASYNVVQSEFANVIAERDAEDRAARVLADELRTRLAVEFAGGR